MDDIIGLLYGEAVNSFPDEKPLNEPTKRKLLTETKIVKRAKNEEQSEDYIIEEVVGDLLESDCDSISQQCNCVSNHGKGLSAAMFEKFPFANDYKNRTSKSDRSKPGTISVHTSPTENVTIINMFAQYYTGPSKFSNDTQEKRLEWFEECLDKMGNLKNLQSFAFPYNIGCGLVYFFKLVIQLY
jgi:O-acetyl-ADP-ribose deacetylase (regulator of RNase III)